MEDEANRDSVRVLRSIIALLLSLANMADRASGRSRAVCAIIVWILRPAETAVSTYCGFEPEAEGSFRSADVREDAVRLAWRLRALADELMCEAEFALMCAGGRSQQRGNSPRLRDLARLLYRLQHVAWPKLGTLDTS